MPQFDQSGPYGMGPMTGRGFGPCGMGFGFRRGGKGLGRGRGLAGYFGWGVPQTKDEQKQDLSNYVKALEEELDDVKKELAEMK